MLLSAIRRRAVVGARRGVKSLRSSSSSPSSSSSSSSSSSPAAGALLFTSRTPSAAAMAVAGSIGIGLGLGYVLTTTDVVAAAAVAGDATCDAAPSPPPPLRQSVVQSNVVLGDKSFAPAYRKHQVALCEWPADQAKHNGDARTSSPRALFKWVSSHGYDGVEMSCKFFEKYYRNMSRADVARAAKADAEKHGLKIFGTNVWWVYDYDGQDWDNETLPQMREEAELTKLMGGEYLTFQVWLHPKYQNTCGQYREDKAYHARVAKRIADLHKICWERDMNCYIETHVQRVTEDPAGFRRIMTALPPALRKSLETNGDLSHYIYRGLRNDFPDMKAILSRMGHTHQRMCRQFGDLSVNVPSPEKDWDAAGVTWQAFDFSKPGLAGGLSSRVICGESGPMHGVTDPLKTDASLVPLYRFMAAYCDAQARGKDIVVESPDDVVNPFAAASSMM